MEFTKKEYKEILIPNGKKIEEFIKSEIQPYLTGTITVCFGETVERGRYNELKEKEFCLWVRRDEIGGNCGGLTLLFALDDYQKRMTGYIDIYDSYGYGGKFIYELCADWTRIKRILLNAVNEQQTKRKQVLENFKID